MNHLEVKSLSNHTGTTGSAFCKPAKQPKLVALFLSHVKISPIFETVKFFLAIQQNIEYLISKWRRFSLQIAVKSRISQPLWDLLKNHRGTFNTLKFDMKMITFLKMD
jgi:hypothetical protein